MEITAMSVSMTRLHSSISTRLLDKAMDHDASIAAMMLEDMANAVTATQTAPASGILDIRV